VGKPFLARVDYADVHVLN